MSFRTDSDVERNHLKSYLGLGVIFAVGVSMAVVELNHIQRMSSTVGMAVFAVLPLAFSVTIMGTSLLLWQHGFDGDEILLITGWMILGMLGIGLLAMWTITHQNIRGRAFAHASFVTVNNVSAGGLIGILLGWYDLLRRRYQRQTETERARLEFLQSSLRHNVLNAVQLILGNLKLLEKQIDTPDIRPVNRIHEGAEELSRFTEATHALMQNYLGQSNTGTRPIDLETVLTDEVEKARRQYPYAEFTLNVPNKIYIDGDDFVEDLFSNLLSNAVVHNNKATPKVTITIHQSNESALVRVADNGPGIPEEEKERVLGWNVKGAESPGRGLGLAIATTIVERYDGSLWIDDNTPEGTVVNTELPVTN